MTALVTGATGLLGNNLVRLLVAGDDRVRAASRTATQSRSLQGLDVERFNLDVSNEEQLRAASEDVDVIYHCAACVRIGWRNADEHQRINVDATIALARLAIERGIRLVHVSSVNALGVGWRDRPATEENADPAITPCPYVLTKREADRRLQQLVQEESLDCVIACPGYMLGPWDWRPSSGEMLLSVAAGKAPLTPTGSMSLCDARDVAQGLILAAEKGRTGRTYVLAGHNLPYTEAWTLMAAVNGRRPPRLPLGPLARFLGGSFGDLLSRIRGQESIVNSAATHISKLHHVFSSQRAIEELGYSIRPAEEIIEDAWNWFQEHGYV